MTLRLIFFLSILIGFPIHGHGQGKAVDIVEEFGRHLNEWSVSGDLSHKNAAMALSAGRTACLVSDSLMMEFERKRGIIPSEYYSLDAYMEGFRTYIYKGKGLTITVLDIKEESEVQFDESRVNPIYRDSISYVSCRIRVSGEMDYEAHDVICIRKGSMRISRILRYEGVRISSDSEVVPRVRVRDISIFETIKSNISYSGIDDGDHDKKEVSYGYSKSYPVNLSYSCNKGYAVIGLDLGFQPNTHYYVEQSYKGHDKARLYPGVYAMSKIGVYLLYTTVSVGIGYTVFRWEYDEISDNSVEVVSNQGSAFVCKPGIAFHIPVIKGWLSSASRLDISPYVAYNVTFKASKMNCVECGLGFRFFFDRSTLL